MHCKLILDDLENVTLKHLHITVSIQLILVLTDCIPSLLHPAGALPRVERSVQSTQLNTTSGNSINTPNIYTVQGPRGRDGRDGLPGRDGRDGVPVSKGEKGDTGLQGMYCNLLKISLPPFLNEVSAKGASSL